jgi:acetyl-CoA acetyltransferase
MYFPRLNSHDMDHGGAGGNGDQRKDAICRASICTARLGNTEVDDVIQTHQGFPYLARHIALGVGVSIEASALTVNRLCGSGLQAVVSGAQMVKMEEV